MNDSSASDRIEPYVWRVAMIVVLGSITSILDTTIVNVALDRLGHDFHTTVSNIQWVVTGYMLALAAVIPVTGWLSRRVGAKTVYLASLILFMLGSALCGLAQSTLELIIFRVLQGFGGGMIMPVGQLMMATAAGPKRMGRVMSVTAVPTMLAPIFGPAIGGLILDNASWRWIFYVNVPISLIALVAAYRGLPKARRGDAGAFDLTGLMLLGTALPAITYGLSEIGITGGFTSPKVVVPIVLGLGLLASFVWHALRVERPLLDIRLFRRGTFASASVTVFCLGAALFGSMILLPLYFQQVRHESTLATGLLVGFQGIGAALMMNRAGRLTDRYGGGWLSLIGVSITALATIPFGLVGAHTSITAICGWSFLRGIGIGLAFMPAMAASYASLRPEELSDATPQMNVIMRTGGSVGTALLAVVLERALRSAPHPLTLDSVAGGYGTAFWWSMGIAAFAIAPAVVLLGVERRARREKAAQRALETALTPSELAAEAVIGG